MVLPKHGTTNMIQMSKLKPGRLQTW